MGMTAIYHTKVPVEHSVAPAHRQNCSTGCSISLWSNRATFTVFNVVGALIWVVGLTVVGYLFGNLPIVQEHLSKIIWALIIIPGLIAIFGAWKARKAEAAA